MLQWGAEAQDMAQNLAGRNLNVDDPRQIPYEDYLAMTEDQREAVEDCFHAVWHPIYLSLLQEQGADWLLVCGEEFMWTSNEAELPDQKGMERLARETNRIPFVVSRPAEIEESGWHATRFLGDVYPTLTVIAEGAGAKLTLVSDFDSGSPCCF